MIYDTQRVALKTLAHMETQIETLAIKIGQLQDMLASGLTDTEIEQLHQEILSEQAGVNFDVVSKR